MDLEKLLVKFENFSRRAPQLRYTVARVLPYLPSVRLLYTGSQCSVFRFLEDPPSALKGSLILSKVQSDLFAAQASRFVPRPTTGFSHWMIWDQEGYQSLLRVAAYYTNNWGPYVDNYMPKSDPQYELFTSLVRLARAFLRFSDSSLICDEFYRLIINMRFSTDDKMNLERVRDLNGYSLEPWGPELAVFDARPPNDEDDDWNDEGDGSNPESSTDVARSLERTKIVCESDEEISDTESEGEDEKTRFYESSGWKDEGWRDWL